jgi:hypothetical protein
MPSKYFSVQKGQILFNILHIFPLIINALFYKSVFNKLKAQYKAIPRIERRQKLKIQDERKLEVSRT